MKTNEDLNLPQNPTLKDFQQYVEDLEEARGFSRQEVLQKCLMLGEEVGELFKAIRKEQKIKIDANSKVGTISEELADVFIYICSIANKFGIDLEQAFREKEEINKKREWK
jgi:NTP pyrophosphatase (non-canonical NTP hydrolase)